MLFRRIMSQSHFWNNALQVAVFTASFCLTTIVYSIVVLPFELMFNEDDGIRNCVLGAWGSLLSACSNGLPTSGRVTEPSKTEVTCRKTEVKQYVRSIQALIDNQRLLEKRYKQTCPFCELESIEIQPRVKAQNLVQLEFQQQTIEGVPTETINDLYLAANEAMETFRSFLSRIAVDVMRTDSKSTIFVAFIKPKKRSLEKAQTDYRDRPGPCESWVFDVVRASILCTSVHEIIALDNWLHVHAYIVQGKNRFKNPVFTGYRDLLYHIRIQPNGNFHHICEIQVHLQPLWELSNRIGLHNSYQTFRSFYVVESTTSLKESQKDLESIARLGFLGESYVMSIMRSGHVERLLRIATLLESLGEIDLSRKLLEMILDRAGAGNVVHAPDVTATICSRIGKLRQQQGNWDVAEELHRRALSICMESLGMTHSQMVNSYNDLGEVLLGKGMPQEALAEFQRAFNVWKKCSGTRQLELATSWNHIGSALLLTERLESAAKALQNALSIELNSLGEDHPMIALTYTKIGCVLQKQKDLDGALKAFRKSVRIREIVLGRDHIDTAQSYQHLGLLLEESAAYDESFVELKKALDIQLRVLGDSPVTAATLNGIGLLFLHQGELESALANFQNALTICKTVRGGCQGADAARYRFNYGNCLLELGQYDVAEDTFQTVLTLLENSVTNKECIDRPTCFSKIATAKWKQGHLDEALTVYEKAIALQEQLVGPLNATVASFCHDKGCILWQQGNFDDAINSLTRAREIRESILGKLHQDTTDTNKTICSVLWQKHDLEGILSELKRQVNNYDEVKEEKVHDQAVAALYKGMGIAWNEMGDMDAALGAFRQALSLRESALGMYHPLSADSYSDVGVVLNRKGDLEGALKSFRQALAIRRKVLGKNHRDTLAARASVESLLSKLLSCKRENGTTQQ